MIVIRRTVGGTITMDHRRLGTVVEWAAWYDP